jgi:hypothetical protein
MFGDKSPDTCKTVLMVGFKDTSDDEISDF